MKKHFLVFLLLLITVCFWSCQVNITNEDIDTTDQKQSMGTTANDDLIDALIDPDSSYTESNQELVLDIKNYAPEKIKINKLFY